MYLLGYDLGSSSIKASLINGETGKCVASAFSPKKEMQIISVQVGWAEQNPDLWWYYICDATKQLLATAKIDTAQIGAIGISYQMHGLVVVDKYQQALRPSIIWCDSRAVQYGDSAASSMGYGFVLSHLLNSPGNFTAAKLAWMKDNEPELFEQVDKAMLPGDYIAMKMTGEACTTVSGLSEGISWDFKENRVSSELFDYFKFSKDIVPKIVPTFGEQGRLSAQAASELGLKEGTPITYRAGDQPNNALSLNVLEPGEVAATAGTSAVVYGINDLLECDPMSRVNTFAHVNHTAEDPRLGVLLCINGAGIFYSWIRNSIAGGTLSYDEINNLSAQVPVGSDGLSVLPFGNGSERILNNREIGASIQNLYFLRHDNRTIYRAAQEGIAFSLKYGMDIMESMGMNIQVIKAGAANMFLSPVFRETLANVTGSSIEIFDTNGAEGAARGAGLGCGYYKNRKEAFASIHLSRVIDPSPAFADATLQSYERWKKVLNASMTNK
ncbi:MAG: FGGY family carbohydrate kinase [Bacteroidales bacterium]|jgi:xylulokinase|nr:FGGY family carbohydrate kinase [Bacteroidales bacterium]